AQLLDLVWPILVLAGVEHVRIAPGDTAFTPLAFVHYPWTHSLLAALLWSVAAAVVYRLITSDARGALVIGILVTSHWLLDALTHRPDLPLWPGSEALVGLGIWNSVAGTIVLESIFFVAGVALYTAATRSRNRAGRLGYWSLIVFLVLIFVANAMGEPPPSERAVAVVALSAWLLPLWAWWADRNRELARES